jgi:hypothetical protein
MSATTSDDATSDVLHARTVRGVNATSRDLLTFSRDIGKVTAMDTTGLDLRLERVAARVKLIDLAQRMGRHRATVARYEGLAVVDADIVYEYRQALATFRDIASNVA